MNTANRDSDLSRLLDHLARQADLTFDLQSALTAFRAVGPENGGRGEAGKADFIGQFLRDNGMDDIVHVDAPDHRVPSGMRPNFVAALGGRSQRSLWLFAHMDVVPEGSLSLWKSDPWQVVRDGDTLVGRGVEDNQQALVSMLLLAQALHACRVVPELGLRLVFVSDEECGNAKGMNWLLEKSPHLFPGDDLYIVPDGGSPDGSEIEVAEKCICRFKVVIRGRQCHASTPHKGVNSLAAAARALVALEKLSAEFDAQDSLFAPPCSTFTPTRHDGNVDGLNILPGEDVFWVDCRLLPSIDPQQVFARATELVQEAAASLGATAEVVIDFLSPASATPVDSPVVKALTAALSARGVTARCVGIGGGTVAAELRNAGLAACVWSTIANSCHEPNEHSSIQATIADAQTFARILFGSSSS